MRKQFSKKEIKELLSIHPEAESFMDKKSNVLQDDDKLLIDGNIIYRKHESFWIPSLELLRSHPDFLPKVIVDKGTPPFILKGADLMRPGIVSCDKFTKDDIVVMVDQEHSFPIGTGIALFSSDELMAQEGGKVVKTLHNLKTD